MTFTIEHHYFFDINDNKNPQSLIHQWLITKVQAGVTAQLASGMTVRLPRYDRGKSFIPPPWRQPAPDRYSPSTGPPAVCSRTASPAGPRQLQCAVTLRIRKRGVAVQLYLPTLHRWGTVQYGMAEYRLLYRIRPRCKPRHHEL